MTRSLLTIVLFVALLLAVPYALRRLQARRGLLGGGAIPGPGSRLVAAVALGPQQRVVTVEVGPDDARTWLVLGVTAQSISCLHVLPGPGTAAGASPAFAAVPASAAVFTMPPAGPHA